MRTRSPGWRGLPNLGAEVQGTQGRCSVRAEMQGTHEKGVADLTLHALLAETPQSLNPGSQKCTQHHLHGLLSLMEQS